MISLFRKRAYDIAGTTPGLVVHLDGQKVSKFNPLEGYFQKDAFNPGL